jgi:hypothetical protein
MVMSPAALSTLIGSDSTIEPGQFEKCSARCERPAQIPWPLIARALAPARGHADGG